MAYDRRTFLKKVMTGAAATGIGSLGLFKANTQGGAKRIGISEPLADEERKKLIYEAHFGPKTPAQSQRGMVICSHPLATREAINVLKSGGNACDAALCAAIVQTVIEPHMTGITGILSMLYFDAATGQTSYVNAGWNTPLEPLGKVYLKDIKSGRALGVPGWWAGFEAALARHGTKPKKEIMAPAIRYARDGFELHPFLWGEIFVQSHRIGLSEMGREIYLPGNIVPRPGNILYQKRAADTLERLLDEGNEFYYRGAFAEAHTQVVQNAGGVITRRDMEAYEAQWLDPQWGLYRGHDIASGGPAVIDALRKIEKLDLQTLGPPTDSVETFTHMLQATTGLKGKKKKSETKEEKLAHQREAELFRLHRIPHPGTCHDSVIDTKGNVAAVFHTSNAWPWDNGLFVMGVSVCAGGYFLLGKTTPGKRGTTASPANIIFKDKKPILVSGSPSISLLSNIVQNTTNILDFNIPIAESVKRPRFGGRSIDQPGSAVIEADFNPSVRKKAEERGFRFDVVNPWNWHHGAFEGIHVDPASGTIRACGDPRRCSKAEGL
jgi:gamma-glutamyltranspeptidase/glutathione hydrolase